jgi:hypothetical protein
MARDKGMGRSLDSAPIEKASFLKQSPPRILAEREAQMDFNGHSERRVRAIRFRVGKASLDVRPVSS